MTRRKIFWIAGVLSVVSIIFPVIVSLYVAWDSVVRKEHERLSFLAERAILRTNKTFTHVEKALQRARSLQQPPCSQPHIDELRRIVVTTRPATEIGYFADGLLKCTSWGHVQAEVPTAAWNTSFVTSHGIAVVLNKHADGMPTISMLGLQHAPYCILVDPEWLVDVSVPEDVQLVLASKSGVVLATLNNPDPATIARIIEAPMNRIHDSRPVAVEISGDWIAIAMSRKLHFSKHIWHERLLLLPITALIVMGMIAVIIWLSRRRLSPLGELTAAIRNCEFIVHYQPLIELKTGICVGAEALVRWKTPSGAMVKPDIFIPLAEESGLICKITDQVIAAVVSDLREALTTDRSLHVAINLSADDIQSGRVLPVIQKATRDADIRPEQIWLEATERSFIDPVAAQRTINEARRLGHSIAIDDFGTGYSGLQYLQSIPADALKIDKSFIDTIGSDAATSSVTLHIIEMAKALDFIIVAEGVERQEQADFLLKHGVQFVQGWLYSKPLPARQFVQFYRRHKSTHGGGPEVIRRF